MIPDVALGAIIALFGTGLAEVAAYFRMRRQERAENIRHHAEFYMSHKVESLQQVHSLLHEIRRKVRDGLTGVDASESLEMDVLNEASTITISEVGELADLIHDSYRSAVSEASAYLEQEQVETLDEAGDASTKALMFVAHDTALRNDDVPDEVVKEMFDDAVSSVNIDADELEEFVASDSIREEFLRSVSDAQDVIRQEIREPIERYER
jgi:hypothetical protein